MSSTSQEPFFFEVALIIVIDGTAGAGCNFCALMSCKARCALTIDSNRLGLSSDGTLTCAFLLSFVLIALLQELIA